MVLLLPLVQRQLPLLQITLFFHRDHLGCACSVERTFRHNGESSCGPAAQGVSKRRKVNLCVIDGPAWSWSRRQAAGQVGRSQGLPGVQTRKVRTTTENQALVGNSRKRSRRRRFEQSWLITWTKAEKQRHLDERTVFSLQFSSQVLPRRIDIISRATAWVNRFNDPSSNFVLPRRVDARNPKKSSLPSPYKVYRAHVEVILCICTSSASPEAGRGNESTDDHKEKVTRTYLRRSCLMRCTKSVLRLSSDNMHVTENIVTESVVNKSSRINT